MTESVEYINRLLRESGCEMECKFSEAKGRTLHVLRHFDRREIIYEGPLLHKVAEDVKNPIYIELTRLFHFNKGDALDYSPMWYWCSLNSLSFRISKYLETISEEKSKQLKMLYHPNVSMPSSTIVRVASSIGNLLDRPFSPDELIELDRMTVIWTLNCFEHAEEPLTYASFFLPSFMSHSCGPSAMWTTIGDRFAIRAQKSMGFGDELTVSYLSEEFGLRPISKRREHLQSTKFFVCDCVRCTTGTDDTRGFPVPERLRLKPTCFLRFPRFDQCACGCNSHIQLTDSELEELLALEASISELVLKLDGPGEEDSVPVRPDPKLIESDETAVALEELVDRMGLFHWASVRGLFQLAEYYKSIAMYPKAIMLTKRRIEGKRNYVRMAAPDVSSGFAWALEELGDLLLLHVSGSVVAGLSEQARERFCENWNPRTVEDVETLRASGALEAYTEAVDILTNVFGEDHEHTKTAEKKLLDLHRRLGRELR
jgi:hypothetical protein